MRISQAWESAFSSQVPFIGAWASTGRDALIQAVSAMPEYARGLIPGVVIGDDTALSAQSVDMIRVLGLSHATAVSGAHISLVLGVAIGVCGRRHPRVTAIICAAMLYSLIVLVGPEASVQRAGLMGALAVFGIAAGRSNAAPTLISVAVMVACMLFPRLAISPGFELSASTTLAIVLFSKPLTRRLRRLWPAWLAEAIGISLIATLTSLPIVASIQPHASLWTVPVNALVAPAMAPMTLCGLAAVLALPVWPTLGSFLLLICKACAWWMYSVAQCASSLPGTGVSIWIVFLVHIVLLCMLLIASAEQSVKVFHRFFLYVRTRVVMRPRKEANAIVRKQMHANKSLRLMPLLIVIAMVCVIAASRVGWIRLPFVGEHVSSDWEVVQCDVGQGSALLVRRGDAVALIDTGPEGGGIDRCLISADVRTIDVLVLSHFDADHVRGLDDVLRTARIGEVWVSGNKNPTYNSQWVLEKLKGHGISVRRVQAGHGDDTWLSVLSPQVAIGAEDTGNADSLVIEVHTKNYSVLALADVPAEIQDMLAPSLQHYDVVIVPHHGAASQSELLAAVASPRVSLISVGENDYGHPTEQALEVWRAPIQATTKECGFIAIGSRGVETQRSCSVVR